jgi:hypothetical protein
MSHRVYSDGVLRKQWDDATRLYTEWDAQGQQTTQRPYTPDENAAADQRAADQAEQDNEQDIRGWLDTAMGDLQTWIDTPLQDITQADLARQTKDNARVLRRLIRLELRQLDGAE